MAIGPVELDAMVNRFLNRVRAEVPVAAVYLYGSYAEGSPDDDSDVDLAVISPKFGTNLHHEMILLGRACIPDALQIEAVPFSVTELTNPSRGSFLREVLRTGRRIA